MFGDDCFSRRCSQDTLARLLKSDAGTACAAYVWFCRNLVWKCKAVSFILEQTRSHVGEQSSEIKAKGPGILREKVRCYVTKGFLKNSWPHIKWLSWFMNLIKRTLTNNPPIIILWNIIIRRSELSNSHCLDLWQIQTAKKAVFFPCKWKNLAVVPRTKGVFQEHHVLGRDKNLPWLQAAMESTFVLILRLITVAGPCRD